MKHTNIRHTFIKYVSLNIIGMIGLSCYILADTFFVARGIGANGLTALNLAIPIYSFIHGIGLMIGMGGATRFAISKREQVFTQATGYAMLAACLFVAVGLFFSTQLATMLGANADTLQNTSIYLKTILCFAPMFLLNNVLICFVRNDGNPKLSMAAMLIGSLSNIVLDYLFIFPCNMGMFGAAFATGIAPVISLIILSAHFIKKQNTFRLRTQKLQIKALWDITSLGLSALIIELSSGIVMIVFN
ncbi:MAG: MATE family efflux transporter, partial [Angelakisella sp.]